jgi:formylglycine-generating enzyme required for sulfatase activity
VPKDYLARFSPEAGGPIISVSWYAAADYCNWLSEKENLPEKQWCYPRDIRSGMKIGRDILKRTGYRLPTEAELEYVCRAGSGESRSFGSAAGLLPRYAIFQANSADRTWPGGQKRPNDLGLFDLHGNVWNWCQDRNLPYPRRDSARAILDTLREEYTIDESGSRILRSASFGHLAPSVRASNRSSDPPVNRSNIVGLRVCRTHD